MLVFLLALLSACETVPEEEGEEYPDWFTTLATPPLRLARGTALKRCGLRMKSTRCASNPETQAIEIVSDLHLVSGTCRETGSRRQGACDYRSVYRESAPPLAHPILQETGWAHPSGSRRARHLFETGCAIQTRLTTARGMSHQESAPCRALGMDDLGKVVIKGTTGLLHHRTLEGIWLTISFSSRPMTESLMKEVQQTHAFLFET